MTPALLRRSPLLLLVLTLNINAGEPVKPVDAKTPKQAVNIPQEEPGWRLDAGAQWRQLGSVNWQTGSLAAHSSLPWLAGRGVRSGSSAANPSGIGDHTYDDGFVNQDAGTPFFGDTAYYGYNSDSQVQGNNLVYHSANGGGSTASSARAFDSSLRRSGAAAPASRRVRCRVAGPAEPRPDPVRRSFAAALHRHGHRPSTAFAA